VTYFLRRSFQVQPLTWLTSLGTGLAGGVALLALLTIAVVSTGVGATRTLVVEAQATGLEVTFSGHANDWSLGAVVVCTPRMQIDRTLPRGAGQCDPRRYLESEDPAFRINWNHNASVRVTTQFSGALALDIAGQTDIQDRTRIILVGENWRTTGALTFNGTAVIGNQLASGETHMILSGSFDAREKPLWSRNTEVLKSGLIRRGESATVMVQSDAGPKRAEVFGHITPNSEGHLGFDVGIVSAPGPVFLELGFFGATRPTHIAPSWVDRALASPLILALAAILSVVLSTGQLVGSAIATLRPAAFGRPLDNPESHMDSPSKSQTPHPEQ